MEILDSEMSLVFFILYKIFYSAKQLKHRRSFLN